jgi:hypothetical protein
LAVRIRLRRLHQYSLSARSSRRDLKYTGGSRCSAITGRKAPPTKIARPIFERTVAGAYCPLAFVTSGASALLFIRDARGSVDGVVSLYLIREKMRSVQSLGEGLTSF